ncbi:MAG: metallophosphoesterase [Terriglobia bacterium]
MNFLRSALLLASLFFATPLAAQKVHTYVGRVGTDSLLLAWGTTDGDGNTIGRGSVPLGSAAVEIAGRRVPSERNWVEVTGLSPDTNYPWRVLLDGKVVGEGTARTNPVRATKLAFFVMGDYGTGSPPQYRIAAAMERELAKRIRSDNPIRFILTNGDNIYPSRSLGVILSRDGRRDRDWGPKFFEPYARSLKRIPFYPSPGNHDVPGMRGEGRNGPGPYLDNFFFPSAEPSPYYTYSYGGLADFFALDTTPIQDPERHLDGVSPGSENSLGAGGRQFEWLKKALSASRAPWKIAYFHHAPFNAGPGHEPSLHALRDVVRLFDEAGVRVVFSGHEHNFQFSRQNDLTGGALYVVSGAGGQLRRGNVRDNMDRANIAGWAPQHHFLLVELEGRALRITPLSWEPVRVTDSNGNPIPLPIVVELPGERSGLSP